MPNDPSNVESLVLSLDAEWIADSVLFGLADSETLLRPVDSQWAWGNAGNEDDVQIICTSPTKKPQPSVSDHQVSVL